MWIPSCEYVIRVSLSEHRLLGNTRQPDQPAAKQRTNNPLAKESAPNFIEIRLFLRKNILSQCFHSRLLSQTDDSVVTGCALQNETHAVWKNIRLQALVNVPKFRVLIHKTRIIKSTSYLTAYCENLRKQMYVRELQKIQNNNVIASQLISNCLNKQ